MSTRTDDASSMLPGMEPPRVPAGSLEAAVEKQIEKLRELGYIEDHHEGQVALALLTARNIDGSQGRGRPSGMAMILRVMNEILEALPQPETASVDTLGDVVRALRENVDEADEEVFDAERAAS